MNCKLVKGESLFVLVQFQLNITRPLPFKKHLLLFKSKPAYAKMISPFIVTQLYRATVWNIQYLMASSFPSHLPSACWTNITSTYKDNILQKDKKYGVQENMWFIYQLIRGEKKFTDPLFHNTPRDCSTFQCKKCKCWYYYILSKCTNKTQDSPVKSTGFPLEARDGNTCSLKQEA